MAEDSDGFSSTSQDSTRGAAIQLPSSVQVVNIGLAMFGEAVREQGAEAVDLEWRIPAGGRPDLVAALTRLYGPAAARIDEANREVVRRLDEGSPVLRGVATALDVVPEVDERTVLHPGPPLAWEDFCDPLRRSVRAAVMAEGWASTPEQAEHLAARGEVRLRPANEHAAVLPMATALGPSAPVFVVENPQGGNRSFSAINQGPGKVQWFGVETPQAVERLVWLREVAGPVLKATLERADPLDLFAVAAQGLQMGDDVHMRTQASTNLFIRHILPSLVSLEDERRVEVARFLSSNHLFFLTLAMAAAKAVTDWAARVAGSSIAVGMARNGTTFGVRLGGLPPERDLGTGSAAARGWFAAPAPPVGDALYYSGFGPEVSAPDIGDSAVLELVGLGGAAAAASPAIASFLGGSMRGAVEETENMERICAVQSSRFKVPFLDFQGSPMGVDVRSVVELELPPAINTGILHASEGLGQIGAGVARAPLACFQSALLALNTFYESTRDPIPRPL